MKLHINMLELRVCGCMCICIFICPRWMSSFLLQWEKGRHSQLIKTPEEVSFLISFPEISESLVGRQHYKYNKSNGPFTMLFPFITYSGILVGHIKVWSLSSVRIILSSAQGDFKYIKKRVASETGGSKRNTRISSSASGQSESLHNFYLLTAFINQNSPWIRHLIKHL